MRRKLSPDEKRFRFIIVIVFLICEIGLGMWTYNYYESRRKYADVKRLCYQCGKPATHKHGPYVSRKGGGHIWLCDKCKPPMAISKDPYFAHMVDGAWARNPVMTYLVVGIMAGVFGLVILMAIFVRP